MTKQRNTINRLNKFIEDLDRIIETADVHDDCRLARIRFEKCERKLIQYLSSQGFADDARVIQNIANDIPATYGAPVIHTLREDAQTYKSRLTVLVEGLEDGADDEPTVTLSVQQASPLESGGNEAPSCFLSYSHDSDEHKEWVRKLAADLRANGVDARLDQWDVRLGTDLPEYMETSIRESDFVLLVCTPQFAAKANKRVGGVGYEKTIVTGEMYEGADPTKFIPVLRHGDAGAARPSYLKAKVYADFSDDGEYETSLRRLLRHIFDDPESQIPPVGKPPQFDAAASSHSSSAPVFKVEELDRRADEYLRELKNRKSYFEPEGRRINVVLVEPEQHSLKIDLGDLPDEFAAMFRPVYGRGCRLRMSGRSAYVTLNDLSDNKTYAATEVSEWGQVRAFESSMLEHQYEPESWPEQCVGSYHSAAIEIEIKNAVHSYLNGLQALGIEGAYLVKIGMLNVRNFILITPIHSGKMPGS